MTLKANDFELVAKFHETSWQQVQVNKSRQRNWQRCHSNENLTESERINPNKRVSLTASQPDPALRT